MTTLYSMCHHPLFYKWENQDSEQVNDLPMVTQPVSRRAYTPGRLVSRVMPNTLLHKVFGQWAFMCPAINPWTESPQGLVHCWCSMHVCAKKYHMQSLPQGARQLREHPNWQKISSCLIEAGKGSHNENVGKRLVLPCPSQSLVLTLPLNCFLNPYPTGHGPLSLSASFSSNFSCEDCHHSRWTTGHQRLWRGVGAREGQVGVPGVAPTQGCCQYVPSQLVQVWGGGVGTPGLCPQNPE